MTVIISEPRQLRGGLGSQRASVPPSRRKARPPRTDPQAAADELVALYGRNVVNWADWATHLAARGLVPQDVTPSMIDLADSRARELRERPRPRPELEVARSAAGDTYPASPGEGPEALMRWAEEVRDMAARRGRKLGVHALFLMCGSRDRSLFGGLFADELKAEKASAPTRPAGAGGLDKYNCRADCAGGRINAQLSGTPKSIAEISSAAGVPESRTSEHLRWCLRHKEHPLGAVLNVDSEGRWYVLELS